MKVQKAARWGKVTEKMKLEISKFRAVQEIEIFWQKNELYTTSALELSWEQEFRQIDTHIKNHT